MGNSNQGTLQSPGLYDVWILGELSTDTAVSGEISSVTKDSDGNITAINGTGTWYKFQCTATSGQFVEAGTKDAQGREVNQQLTYRFVGMTQAQRNTIEDLALQSRLKIVGSLRGSKNAFLFGEENGMDLLTDNFDTGVGGGGAGAIGTNVVFQGNELSKANALLTSLSTTAQSPMTVE